MSLSREQLTLLSEIVTQNIELFFEYFGVPYNGGDRLYIPCPIHKGNNQNGLNIYMNGTDVPFYYVCRTHHCEKIFKSTAIGFIRGLLSAKADWCQKGDAEVLFSDTIKFIFSFLNIDENNLKVDPNSNYSFLKIASYQDKIKLAQPKKIDRDRVRKALQIPAEYYIRKGYGKNVLNRYDVGLCNDPGKDMFMRVVFPIYDEDHKGYVGCTGRSVFDKCKRCELYHPAGSCPKTYQYKYSKWRHHGFESKTVLYNYWFAKEYIKRTNTAIIVESPGNVLKLEEAGINNAVAVFGTNFSDTQQFLLEKVGTMRLILAFDNDEAGRLAGENIIQKCSKLYNIEVVKFENYNDVAEMSTGEIQDLFRSF